MSSHDGNPLASRADHAERALIGALLGDSKEKRTVFAALGMGECLSSHRLRVIYTTCLTILSEGREPDLVCLLDWLQDHGHLDEAGGATFLASLVRDLASDAMIELYCRDVLRAYGRRQAQEALVEAEKKLASGEHVCDVWTGLSQKISQLQQEEQSGGLKVLSASELLSEEVPEVKWCVDGLIPSNGFGMIAGESGCGKTWLLLSLSIAVASGTPWLGTFTTTKGNVLFIDEESGISLLKHRLLKLGEPEEMRSLPIYFATFEQLKMDTAQGKALLEATIKKTGARLVVIDSFVRIHDSDENSAGEMSRVTEALSRIARDLNCAIVVAHHARKPSSQASKEPGHMVRGTTEIKAAVDVHLFVTRDKNGAIRIEHEKARYGKTVEPVLVELEEDSEGRIRLSCVKEAVAKLEQAKAAIVEALTGAEQPILRRDLEAIVCREKEISQRTFAEGLGELRNDGKLEESFRTEHTAKGGTRSLKAFLLKRGSCNDSRPHGADFRRGG